MQNDDLEREYTPQPSKRMTGRSIESRRYKREPRYSVATQQLTTDSDTDRSSETDSKQKKIGAKFNKIALWHHQKTTRKAKKLVA